MNILTSGTVNADAGPASRPGDAGAAAARFAAGEEAFRRGEYVRAGELFEEAHATVAHHDSAWNAAHAWLGAGDRARAATWFATFLDEAPADAPDRAEGRARLDELARTLGRIDVDARGVEAVNVDGRRIPRRTAYVVSGSHRVEGRAGDASVSETVQVGEGRTARVTLAAPPVSPPASPPGGADKPGLAPIAPAGKPWPPGTVVIGGLVTAGLAGTAIGFGIATEAAHDRFAAERSEDAFDDGRAKQDLANGFFWGAIAAGVVTTAVALFLVDYKRPLFSF